MASQGAPAPEETKKNRQDILRDLVMSASWVDASDTSTSPEEQVAKKYQHFLNLSPKAQEDWEESLSPEEREIIGEKPYVVIRQVLLDMGVETFTYAVLQGTKQETNSPLTHSFSLPQMVNTSEGKEDTEENTSPSFGSPLDRDQQEFPRPEALHTRTQRLASRIAEKEIPNSLLLSPKDTTLPFAPEDMAKARVREELPLPSRVQRRQSVEMDWSLVPQGEDSSLDESSTRRQSVELETNRTRTKGATRRTTGGGSQKKKGTLTGALVKGGAVATVIGGTATIGSAFLLDLLGFHT